MGEASAPIMKKSHAVRESARTRCQLVRCGSPPKQSQLKCPQLQLKPKRGVQKTSPDIASALKEKLAATLFPNRSFALMGSYALQVSQEQEVAGRTVRVPTPSHKEAAVTFRSSQIHNDYEVPPVLTAFVRKSMREEESVLQTAGATVWHTPFCYC
uniref:Uncharacterized protein n=1 Tax=Sphaerodactylus townsendi TaxID=933632 RepID=A0ACB8E9L0_9SAUR